MGVRARPGIGAVSTSTTIWRKSDAILGPDVNGNDGRQHRRVQGAWREIASFITAGRIRSSTRLTTIAFYETLAKAPWGSATRCKDSARLFLLPGVEHCGVGRRRGAGCGSAARQGLPAPRGRRGARRACRAWPNGSRAERRPEKLIATKYQGDDPTKPIVMQRPACPYPKMAHYTGSGDTNAAASFVCE